MFEVLEGRFLIYQSHIYNGANESQQTVDNNEEFHELQGLQIRLDSKIRVSD